METTHDLPRQSRTLEEDMTCVVGLRYGGTVFIGGDSAGSDEGYVSIRSDPKVFLNGEFLFGFTSSFRMGQLLRYSFTPPKMHAGEDISRFMAVDFIDQVRLCLKSGGFARCTDESESGGTFLVGFRGRLFFIDSDYQVGEPASGYDAVGCGRAVALGSLYESSSQDPVTRVRNALEAAAYFCDGVRPPFTILKV